MANNKKDYPRLADKIVDSIGGANNVSLCVTCFTRLRFNLVDDGLAQLDQLKKLDGVLGAQWSGGQLQVVIGPDVSDLYPEVQARLRPAGAVHESTPASGTKKPRTIIAVGNAALNFIISAMTPLIPVIVCAAFFRAIAVTIGPETLGLVSAQDSLYFVLNLVYQAGFFFLPIYLGYTAASKAGVTPILGMFMGGVLVAPALIQLATDGQTLRVFGIPAPALNYSQTIIPILLTVWVMGYVERFFIKRIPAYMRMIFVPFLTMLVMLPITLGLLAPIGFYISQGLTAAIMALGAWNAAIAVAIIAAIWMMIVVSGVHIVLVGVMLTVLATNGHDALIGPAAMTALFAAAGVTTAALVRMKDPTEKALIGGYLASMLIGGAGEPMLYGMALKYKRPFVAMALGGFVGGLYAGLTGAAIYSLSASNFLFVLSYAGGTTGNFVNGMVAGAAAFVVGGVAMYILGFPKLVSPSTDDLTGSDLAISR